jgi:hypothetical protein
MLEDGNLSRSRIDLAGVLRDLQWWEKWPMEKQEALDNGRCDGLWRGSESTCPGREL